MHAWPTICKLDSQTLEDPFESYEGMVQKPYARSIPCSRFWVGELPSSPSSPQAEAHLPVKKMHELFWGAVC